jgi:hypothetical protein
LLFLSTDLFRVSGNDFLQTEKTEKLQRAKPSLELELESWFANSQDEFNEPN